MNCWPLPSTTEGLAGVTAMETNAGADVTVKAVEPLIEPSAAVMVVLPAETLVASPVVFIVATPGVEELHVAVLVRF